MVKTWIFDVRASAPPAWSHLHFQTRASALHLASERVPKPSLQVQHFTLLAGIYRNICFNLWGTRVCVCVGVVLVVGGGCRVNMTTGAQIKPKCPFDLRTTFPGGESKYSRCSCCECSRLKQEKTGSLRRFSHLTEILSGSLTRPSYYYYYF